MLLTNPIRSFRVHLSDAILLEACKWAVENDMEAKGLIQPDFCEALIATVGAKG